jgi:predicted N-acyltransferase
MSRDEWIWYDSFLDIPDSGWDLFASAGSPFFDSRFLQGLERSGCIGTGTAWEPRVLFLKSENSFSLGTILYQKWDSYGEYIFDFEWANAYQRSGLEYYPKYTAGIPFTPVTSPKIFYKSTQPVSREKIKNLIAQIQARAIRDGISGVHVLFHPESEITNWSESGFSGRVTTQFHWTNRGYRTFQDFLDALKKDRRKTIRKERQILGEAGIRSEILVGEKILSEHCDLFWKFYKNTHQKKWGQAYLNREFFRLIFQEFRDLLLLVLAYNKEGDPIAGSLNFLGKDVLYGRYWGATHDIPFLHFECCYYQQIDYCIKNGFAKFEAGAQGEHKYLRGFEVVPIHSSHYFFHEGARLVINRFLDSESKHMDEAIHDWNLKSPLKIFREESGEK